MGGDPSQSVAGVFWRRAFFIGGLLATVTWAGCGKRSDRLAVDGKVTLDGTPLDSGSIRFTSTGEGKLFATGAMIQDGEYHIPRDKGLPPGTYRVEISAPDTKAPLVVSRPAPGEPPAPPMAPERIPAEYNTESDKTVQIEASQDNRFEFAISSGRGK